MKEAGAPPSVCFVSLSAYGYFDSSTPVAGGAERQLSLLGAELSDEWSVSFVVGDYGQSAVETNEDVLLFRAYRPDPTAGAGNWAQQLFKLYRAMKQADADIYVYRGGPTKAAVTYVLARLLRRPWVYNLSNDSNIDSDPDTLPVPIAKAFKQALNGAAAVIAQTAYQQRRLNERFGVSSVVVPNGYPSAENPPPYENRTHVLWVGRFDPDQKRPHLFLDLAEELPALSFKLAGIESNDRQYYEQVYARAERLDNVDFLGAVDPDAIHEYYRSAIALVNTSKYEGFPNTFLEAWRQQTPVVSLEVDIGRYLQTTKAGYCDGSWKELVSTVHRLATDESMWEQFSETALEHFQQNFTMKTVAERYCDVLRNVV